VKQCSDDEEELKKVTLVETDSFHGALFLLHGNETKTFIQRSGRLQTRENR